MSTKRLIPLLLAVLAIALVAAGCGSSKKSGESGSSKITKAEFLRKGNAICAQGNKELDAQGKKLFAGQKSKPTKAQIAEFAKKYAIPSVEKQVNGIRALGAPAGDEDKVKAILDAADEGVAKLKQDPAALAASEGSDPFAKANKLARDYGLTVCGS